MFINLNFFWMLWMDNANGWIWHIINCFATNNHPNHNRFVVESNRIVLVRTTKPQTLHFGSKNFFSPAQFYPLHSLFDVYSFAWIKLKKINFQVNLAAERIIEKSIQCYLPFSASIYCCRCLAGNFWQSG